jgi:hypothetical protein
VGQQLPAPKRDIAAAVGCWVFLRPSPPPVCTRNSDHTSGASAVPSAHVCLESRVCASSSSQLQSCLHPGHPYGLLRTTAFPNILSEHTVLCVGSPHGVFICVVRIPRLRECRASQEGREREEYRRPEERLRAGMPATESCGFLGCIAAAPVVFAAQLRSVGLGGGCSGA